jgi:polar amino acid transport system ATP-binding protein
MLTIKNLVVKKGLPSKPILNGISLSFNPGEISLLLGKSGAGKSTLMRCVAHLETSYEGEICFNGQSIKELTPSSRAKTLSYIAQSYTLFPHLTALQNCSQPLEVVFKITKADAERKGLKCMESLGMGDFACAYPSELSGGQQQRIAIARALTLNPQILLFDEPSSALDPDNTMQLAKILRDLASNGTTIIVSTQDMPFAEELKAKAYTIEKGRLKL